jgi:hypothetical protein
MKVFLIRAVALILAIAPPLLACYAFSDKLFSTEVITTISSIALIVLLVSSPIIFRLWKGKVMHPTVEGLWAVVALVAWSLSPIINQVKVIALIGLFSNVAAKILHRIADNLAVKANNERIANAVIVKQRENL